MVEDTGRGIAAEDLPRLFSPFSQVHGEAPGTFGGTGLGLVLTRALAESMGGSVGVESTPGVGTRFTVTLPVDG